MISIAITSYNRSELTIESFSKVWDHPLVSEIVIVDDASEDEHWYNLLGLIEAHPASEKIQVFRNEINLNMSRNKREAVSKAKNEWTIILDSDNILYPEYLDAIKNLGEKLNPNIIYHPICAEPDYDFKLIGEEFICKHNAKNFLHIKEFRLFLNNCNFFVNRDRYLEVYKWNKEIKESDSIWFNYLWLEAGNSFFFVKGMKYFHRRHPGSGWLNGDHKYNLKKAAELQEKIKNL